MLSLKVVGWLLLTVSLIFFRSVGVALGVNHYCHLSEMSEHEEEALCLCLYSIFLQRLHIQSSLN